MAGEGEPAGDDPQVRRRATVERVLAVLRSGEGPPLRLAEMADVACLSPFHFSRVFATETGLSPVAFQTALRMERAKRLLLATELSVTEVCFETGYESLGTFTSRFTRLVGLPPSLVRHFPELAAAAIGRLTGGEWEEPPVGPIAGVGGWVQAPTDLEAVVFVGLFPLGIAQGRPIAGTALRRPGPYRLPVAPDGRYRILAAALPIAADPAAYLLPAAGTWVGADAGGVAIAGGRVVGSTDLLLRAPRETDPPVLAALPTLLLDRADGRWTAAERKIGEAIVRAVS